MKLHGPHAPAAHAGAATAASAAKAAKNDPAHQAAKQLEAFFLRRMLTEAHGASGGGMLDGGFAGDTFKQMMDDALADKMSAAGGIGMADMMATQLEKQAGGADSSSSAASAMLADHAMRPLHGGGRTFAAIPVGDPSFEAHGPAGAPKLQLPVAGTPTSGYGKRIDPVHGGASVHPGFDLAAPTGTPVGAAAGGTITHAGPAGTYGNLIIIKHDNGYETRYAHLSAVTVKVGDKVESGQQVGNVGTTGYSTGPHLHFEVRHDGNTIDPEPLLPLNKNRGRTNR